MYNWLVLHILRSLFLLVHKIRPTQQPSAIDLNCVHRVLLVITTAVGDTLMCTPAVRAVRKVLPNADISVMVDRRRIPLLSENPHIDRIIIYPGKFKRLKRLLRELRSVNADLAIILYANDPDIVPLVYLSGAPVRVGWAESKFAFLMTHPVQRPADQIHFVEHRGLMTEAAGISLDSMQMELYPSKEDEAYIDHYLQKQRMKPGTQLIALHPFGTIYSKWWPEENVIELLKTFSKHSELEFILIGSKNEKKAIEHILKQSPKNVWYSGEDLDIGKLAALIRRVTLFVGTDSGPMHIAAALNVPRVEIYGPSLPEMFGTEKGEVIRIKTEFECVQPCWTTSCPEPKCMISIRPERVYLATLQLIRDLAKGNSV
ncbi:MAG: glycosyltransferase family 9 protein [Deltaproteobacteria bacterium]|nr:glycosyltransferase family 9 protein [Deltaproteobacteria bacterium]